MSNAIQVGTMMHIRMKFATIKGDYEISREEFKQAIIEEAKRAGIEEGDIFETTSAYGGEHCRVRTTGRYTTRGNVYLSPESKAEVQVEKIKKNGEPYVNVNYWSVSVEDALEAIEAYNNK